MPVDSTRLVDLLGAISVRLEALRSDQPGIQFDCICLEMLRGSSLELWDYPSSGPGLPPSPEYQSDLDS